MFYWKCLFEAHKWNINSVQFAPVNKKALNKFMHFFDLNAENLNKERKTEKTFTQVIIQTLNERWFEMHWFAPIWTQPA